MKIRKLLLIVCSMLCMLMVAACGSAKPNLNGLTDDEVYSMAEDYLTYLQGFTEDAAYEEMADEEFTTVSDISIIEEVQDLSIMKVVASAYTDSLEDYGTFIGISEKEITNDADSMTVVIVADYTEHQMKMETVFDKDLKLESITADPVLSVKEILIKALINTLLGMGTVFVVLIFISFIISGFKLLSKVQDKGAKKEEKKEDLTQKFIPVAEPEVEEIDDYELIAVISAAIAAAEGTSVEGFKVRSIKRANNSTWKRA